MNFGAAPVFPECVAKCSRDPAFGVRNRPSAAVVGAKLPCLWESRKNVAFLTCPKLWSCRFAWQAWHFVTFHVCEVQDCREAEVAVPMRKVAKACLFDVSEDVVISFLRGRRDTLWHSMCVRCKTVVRLKLPCLWEKSQKRVFFDVSEAVVMSFCVARVALCDIPTFFRLRPSWAHSCRAYGKVAKRDFFDVSEAVLMSFCVASVPLCDIPTFFRLRPSWAQSCRAYGKSRKRDFFDVSQAVLMSFCVARVELCDIPTFFRLRPSWVQSCRAYENSRKNVTFLTCPKLWSCRFAWQAWHFVTFHVCEVQDCREAEVAVPIGKVAKACLFRCVRRCGHVVFA